MVVDGDVGAGPEDVRMTAGEEHVVEPVSDEYRLPPSKPSTTGPAQNDNGASTTEVAKSWSRRSLSRPDKFIDSRRTSASETAAGAVPFTRVARPMSAVLVIERATSASLNRPRPVVKASRGTAERRPPGCGLLWC